MSSARTSLENDPDRLLRMPAWVTSGFAETSEDVAFLSGVALGHMDLVTRREDVPQALLRARLALAAAGHAEDAVVVLEEAVADKGASRMTSMMRSSIMGSARRRRSARRGDRRDRRRG